VWVIAAFGWISGRNFLCCKNYYLTCLHVQSLKPYRGNVWDYEVSISLIYMFNWLYIYIFNQFWILALTWHTMRLLNSVDIVFMYRIVYISQWCIIDYFTLNSLLLIVTLTDNRGHKQAADWVCRQHVQTLGCSDWLVMPSLTKKEHIARSEFDNDLIRQSVM